MLPRWHIVWGAVFTLLIWIVNPETPYVYLGLLFLASFLIDFDHYLSSVIKTGKIGLIHSLEYHRKMQITEEKERKKGIREKGDFHLFHTVEFLALVGFLGLAWTGFFYIFVGMMFHSLLDVIWLLKNDFFYRREYFFFNWIGKKISKS